MKILVPLDGSSKSESVLPMVALLSERWQAEVHALRVMDPSIGAADPFVLALSESAYQRMVDDGREYLADLVKRHPEMPLHTQHQVGAPAFCIDEVARKESCELIVMATHGHTGLLRWLWGSVAEGVARHAPCPTMLVRTPDTPVLFREILVPTDGSDSSLEVTRHIGRFLAPETKVTLLHCAGVSAEQAAENAELRVELELVREGLRQQVEGRPWMRLECVSSPAPQGIFDWLADHDCDLVAMSTHGRDGIAHLWMGSMMEEVARHSNCPVLVFPPSTLNSEFNEEVAHANL
ncbi:universal stress protein [bacterium]|nr:universal stress protein [bacterium]